MAQIKLSKTFDLFYGPAIIRVIALQTAVKLLVNNFSAVTVPDSAKNTYFKDEVRTEAGHQMIN